MNSFRSILNAEDIEFGPVNERMMLNIIEHTPGCPSKVPSCDPEIARNHHTREVMLQRRHPPHPGSWTADGSGGPPGAPARPVGG